MIVKLIKRLLIYNSLLITKKKLTSPNHNTRHRRKYCHPCGIGFFFLAEPTSNKRSNYCNHNQQMIAYRMSTSLVCSLLLCGYGRYPRARENGSAIVRKQERTRTIMPGGSPNSFSVLMPTAGFSVRHSHHYISYSSCILPKVSSANIRVNSSFYHYKQIIN